MRFKFLSCALLVLFSTFSLTSCDKDTEEPLALHDVENNSLELYYGAKGGVTIVGGDGNYSFSTESPLIKAEMTHSNYVLFEALNVGDAAVTITDQSGHSCVLKIHIGYYSMNIVVVKLDATVVGDNMTVGEQKELKEKALATIPVKVGGGYKFVYTGKVNSSSSAEDLNPPKNLVYIYPETYGEKPIEGTFERTTHKEGDGRVSYYTYTLHYNGLNRTLLFLEYKSKGAIVRSVEYRTYQLAEDLTEQYKTDYPNVEQVYTSQVIGSISR